MRVVKEMGYLDEPTLYREFCMAGYMEWEERTQKEEKAGYLTDISETLFFLLDRKLYQQWKRNKEQVRKEEGVDEVIYSGESDEAYKAIEELSGFSMDEFYDLFGDE